MKFGEREADLDILSGIESRIAAADERYGPFASTHEALGVAVEEWDELRLAIHDNNMGAVQRECLDLAAVLIRLVMSLRENQSTWNRSQK